MSRCAGPRARLGAPRRGAAASWTGCTPNRSTRRRAARARRSQPAGRPRRARRRSALRPARRRSRWRRSRRPSLRRPRTIDLGGGRDQPDVAVRLREVAELLAVGRVDLLAEEAEVVRIARELVVEPLGAVPLA